MTAGAKGFCRLVGGRAGKGLPLPVVLSWAVVRALGLWPCVAGGLRGRPRLVLGLRMTLVLRSGTGLVLGRGMALVLGRGMALVLRSRLSRVLRRRMPLVLGSRTALVLRTRVSLILRSHRMGRGLRSGPGLVLRTLG